MKNSVWTIYSHTDLNTKTTGGIDKGAGSNIRRRGQPFMEGTL